MQDSTRATEFDLIDQYFTLAAGRDDVVVTVGDDAAVLQAPAGRRLVMTMDTLIAGVHFPPGTAPQDIAYKCIAVNISDLAAMGAAPAWLMLSISLPEDDHDWLSAFSSGFMQACKTFGVDLVGGDTTRGALSVTVQATGFVEADRELRRGTAQLDDDIYVSGSIGDAALALNLLDSDRQVASCLQRLERPQPRVDLGRALAEVCRCAIDVSDGLVADLGHILRLSHHGAEIELESIPLSAGFRRHFDGEPDIDALQLAITGGDDYELCFTAAQDHRRRISEIAEELGLAVTRIGRITGEAGLDCLYGGRHITDIDTAGYSHF